MTNKANKSETVWNIIELAGWTLGLSVCVYLVARDFGIAVGTVFWVALMAIVKRERLTGSTRAGRKSSSAGEDT